MSRVEPRPERPSPAALPAGERLAAPAPAPVEAPAPVAWWKPRVLAQTFASLDSPAFARYFWATLAFTFAMQMQMLLRGYLIFDLTGDPLALGVISVTFALPMLVIAPVAGVVADRFDRRTVIVASQSIGLALTGLTTALILTGAIAYWQLVAISLVSSSTMVFNMPARQALVPRLVRPERLMNAIALGSGTMNLSRIVAPSLAGLLVVPIGVGGGYLVTLIGNALAVLLFLGVPAQGKGGGPPRRSFFGDMADGVSYLRANRLLLLLLAAGIVPMLLAMPHQNLLPVFTGEVWPTGAVGLGLLQTMAGVGGLVGVGVAANLGGVRRQALLMTGAFVGFGLCIALFALAPAFLLALVFVLLADTCSMIGMTTNNTVIQRIIPDSVRGRVMSLMMMTFGITPLGTLPASWLAREYGVRAAVAGGGALLVVVALLIFALSRSYRQLDRHALDGAGLPPRARPGAGAWPAP
jgi:MFS family permease